MEKIVNELERIRKEIESFMQENNEIIDNNYFIELEIKEARERIESIENYINKVSK